MHSKNNYIISKKPIFWFYILILSSFFIVTGKAVANTVPESSPLIVDVLTEDFKGIDKAVERVLSYFNQVKGAVEKSQDGVVWIRTDNKTGLIKGMRLSGYRDGDMFYHPVTSEPIGNTEEFVGRLEVTEEDAVDGLHACSVLSGEFHTGDKVRITSSNIKIAYFQDRSSDWTISELFYNSLKKTGRFEILESYTSSYDPALLVELGKKHEAAAVLLFSTSAVNASKHLHIKMYWTEDFTMLSSIDEPLNPEEKEETQQAEGFLVRSKKTVGLQKIYEIERGSLFAIGDVDGDGIDNVVVGDGNNISVYSVDSELRKVWSVKEPGSRDIISIDILDVNKNGVPEIFVTAVVDMREPRSFVIEHTTDRGFTKIAKNIPYFLRSYENLLLLQKSGHSRAFVGPVYQGKWTNGTYREGERLELPRDVNIYGFTHVDWESTGQSQVVSLDDNGYLRFYDSKGKLQLMSGRSFGKPEFSFRRELSTNMEYEEWFVRGRLMKVTAEKGESLVVVNRIPASAMLPVLGSRGGEVYSLWKANNDIQVKLIQKEIPGSVSDYIVKGNSLFVISKGSTLSRIKSITSQNSKKSSLLFHFVLDTEHIRSSEQAGKNN